MMDFKAFLEWARVHAPEQHTKGKWFEQAVKTWMKSDPRFNTQMRDIWLWNEFPGRASMGGGDLGIDLVAEMVTAGSDQASEFWAIQCKFYDKTTIAKEHVDSFVAHSAGEFEIRGKMRQFARRIWIDTGCKWNKNAEASASNLTNFSRFTVADIDNCKLDWSQLIEGHVQNEPPRVAREHQQMAVQKAAAHFAEHDRGMLVMACGTGKTLTSLRIAERLCQHRHLGADHIERTVSSGLVLFLVPSIALLGQAYNAWKLDAVDIDDARKHAPLMGFGVCSDAHANDKRSKKSAVEDLAHDSIADITAPCTTNAEKTAERMLSCREFVENGTGLCVIFSTYQSIEAVEAAQKRVLEETGGTFGTFDLVICDEAHRTTKACCAKTAEDTPAFLHVHDDALIRARKRLYMTATPRIYSEAAKASARAKTPDLNIASMDDVEVFGEEFHRISFNDAVQQGLLTDYKVIVLTVSEDNLPQEIRADVEDPTKSEIDVSVAARLCGCIQALSKQILGDNDRTRSEDPQLVRRALAFCPTIGSEDTPGTSKNIAAIFPDVCHKFRQALPVWDRTKYVQIEAEHVDGSMPATERNNKLAWLEETPTMPHPQPLSKGEGREPHTQPVGAVCRVLCNVRCLSEGVDVPALDAVIFMSPRKSQVEVVQSVGRVMRNFKRGEEGGKKYGYIVIPVVIPSKMSVEKALEDNERFKAVWQVLNALRSHDEHFNAIVNQINLNQQTPDKIVVVEGGYDPDEEACYTVKDNQKARQERVARQLEMFGPEQKNIYAKIVNKVGDRMYWANWVNDIARVATDIIERINGLIEREPEAADAFNAFMDGLRQNINDAVARESAIEMLAQHIVAGPVFDALFKDYGFCDNNAVSRTMENVVRFFESRGLRKDTVTLNKFYKSIEYNVSNIDNAEGKQRIIKELYDNFFRLVFPKTVEKLGIVYTPIECVDFILHSVEDLMHRHFGCSISDENVHVLDPFVGTGSFITRLMQSGIIKPRDLERKYRRELHCNEIVPLAYYVADVNIENVFHSITQRKEYLNYDGICLTDTFQLYERNVQKVIPGCFEENSEEIENQRKAPIRVIVCNPPYSVGQKSANDNAQNQSYPQLEARIADTYAKNSKQNLLKGLYDSYIKAIRWATDRINETPGGGVIGFISNAGWIDSMGADGLRKCLGEEFNYIYIYNLRGDQRTQGELSRKEGGKIFGSGSRTPIAMTFLVKLPEGEVSPCASMTESYAATLSAGPQSPAPQRPGSALIQYEAVADYLKREEKLDLVKSRYSICSKDMQLTTLTPDENNDWLSQRNDSFEKMIPLDCEKKFVGEKGCVFEGYTLGVSTNRDIWTCNFSYQMVFNNMRRHVEFYNQQVNELRLLRSNNPNADVSIVKCFDESKIKWSSSLDSQLSRMNEAIFQPQMIYDLTYRPFIKSKLYFGEKMVERPGQNLRLFPTPAHENLIIAVHGAGSKKDWSCLMMNHISCLDCLEKGQDFPLYYYDTAEERSGVRSLFSSSRDTGDYMRHDGITDWMYERVCEAYGLTPNPSPKERGLAQANKSFDTESLNDKRIEYKTSNKQMWHELKDRAREGRKDQTEAENALWQAIRNKKLGYTFRRQHPIHVYIADFVCLEKMLIIEVDGDYHLEANQQYIDEQRTHDLNSLGYRVIRFTNNEVLHHLSDVLQKIQVSLTPSPMERGQGGEAITKEDIFYYVYGILHHPTYRATYANDLKKSLPRIPIVEKVEDFKAFVKAGRELGELHVNYESVEANGDVKVTGAERGRFEVDKMKLSKDGRTLTFNSDITISNIPVEVDEYIVNGRTALGWLVDQYQYSVDKASGIINDPNDWGREHDNPRYIFDLVLSIIELSVRTVHIVRGLPELKCG